MQSLSFSTLSPIQHEGAPVRASHTHVIKSEFMVVFNIKYNFHACTTFCKITILHLFCKFFWWVASPRASCKSCCLQTKPTIQSSCQTYKHYIISTHIVLCSQSDVYLHNSWGLSLKSLPKLMLGHKNMDIFSNKNWNKLFKYMPNGAL